MCAKVKAASIAVVWLEAGSACDKPVFSFKSKIQLIGTIGPFEKGFYKDFSILEKINLLINKYLMIYDAFSLPMPSILHNSLFLLSESLNDSINEIIFG